MPNLFWYSRARVHKTKPKIAHSSIKYLMTLNRPYRKYLQAVEKHEKIATFVLIIPESSGV